MSVCFVIYCICDRYFFCVLFSALFYDLPYSIVTVNALSIVFLDNRMIL